MAKKKRTVKENAPVYILLPNSMSVEEMQHIIAEALVDAEKKKADQLEEQKKEETKSWQENIGIKDYSCEKKPRRWFLEVFNVLDVLWRMSFISKDKISGDRMTVSILQLFLSLFFSTVDKILLVFSVYLIIVFPALELYSSGISSGIQIFISVGWGVLAFLGSRIFRISSIEIENMKDRDNLFGVFACITAIISIIISVIGITVNKG